MSIQKGHPISWATRRHTRSRSSAGSCPDFSSPIESPADARSLIRSYRNLLEDKGNGDTLWKELRASNVMGVTRGPLGREE